MSWSGAVAQLGERYNGIVEVAGSIPAGSTKNFPNFNGLASFLARFFIPLHFYVTRS